MSEQLGQQTEQKPLIHDRLMMPLTHRRVKAGLTSVGVKED